MKNFTRLITVSLLLFFTLLSHRADASHYKGGDIYFVCLGGGQYELIFSAYYACEASSIRFDSIPTDFSWSITSTCGLPASITAATASISQDVPFYCPGIATTCDYWDPSLDEYNAPPGTAIGTAVVTYTSAPFTIPAGCTVTATMDVSARNGAISNLQNPASQDLNIETTVTTPATGLGCSNNPVFAAYPVNIFCVNENANFSQGAIDISGDSLTYTLINPQTAGGIAIPFVTGCSATNPLGAPSVFASVFTFDSTTGNINFTPTATGDYVLAVQVNAYQNGVLVGSTVRDIQFTVIQCNNYTAPPFLTSLFTTHDVTGATVIDSTHIGVCPGEQMEVNLVATIGDSFQYVIDSTNALQSLPGSTVTVTHSGTKYDTATLHITWTPNNSDSGYHYILVTVKDTICPLPGRQTYAFLISVLSGLYAGPNLVYCNGGAPVTIYAAGANHYLWTDSATGGPPLYVVAYGPDSSWIEVDPPVNTGYIVHGDLLGSCKNIDTVKVVNAPDFVLSAAALDTSICKYTSTTLTATSTPGSVGPFAYSWTPATSVVSPTSGTTSTTGLTASTMFYVTAVALAGCTLHDSVRVDINGAAPRISILPSNNNVCPGDTVQLNSLVLAENLVSCGIVDSCVNNNFNVSDPVPNNAGALATSTGSGGFTSVYCSPFMGSLSSYKAQYLFTKAELNAAGLSSGTITDLSFFVQTVNSTIPYDTFTISMGCTNVDSLTDFIQGLQVVAGPLEGPAAPFVNQGWNSFPFYNPFSYNNTFYGWDGSSNIVVQVCYTISPNATSNDDFVAYSTTSYNGSCIYTGDYGFDLPPNGCSFNYGSTFDFGIVNTRPTIKFGMCVPSVLSYLWSPASLPCDTCTATTIIVDSTRSYSLRVSDGVCTNDTSVTVAINPYIPTVAVPDTTLCGNGDSVRLHVALSNPPVSQCIEGYTVTSIPYSPIAGTATSINPNDFEDEFQDPDQTLDGAAGPINIGFTFPFYCQTYSSFYVDANGWITFTYPYTTGQGAWEYTAEPLPPATIPPQYAIELMMANYWLADGFGDGFGNVSYFVSGTAPNRILVVKFNNMEDANLLGTSTSGEMHLHETSGVIDILLQSSNYSGVQHTTGIIDSIGIGTAAPGRNDSAYTISTPEAWRFTPENGPSVAVASSVWSPNSYISSIDSLDPLVYPASTTTYYVTSELTINQFTNPSQCRVVDTVTVTIAVPQFSLTESPNPICPGDTAQLLYTPLGGDVISSYTWTPAAGLNSTTIANPTASILDTTTYHVTAVDNHGCKIKDSITLDIVAVQHPNIGPDQTICYSDSVLLALPTGSYSSYQWYSVDSVTGVRTLVSSGPADSTYEAHPAGYYVLEVTSAGATCPYFTNMVFVDTFARQAIVVDTSGPTSFCVGGNVVLQVTQNLNNIQWTPSSYGSASSIPVTSSGVFSYIARDVHNCLLYSDTVHVIVNAPAAFVVSPYKDPICTNATDTITAGSSPTGASITWTYQGTQTQGGTIIAADSGTYDIEADLQGCISDTAIMLAYAVSPAVSLPSPAAACNCAPSYILTPAVNPASPADTYVWSDGTHGSTTTDTSIGSTTYIVTVTDANGCTSAATAVVTFNCPKVDISVNPATDTIFISDTAALYANAAPGSTGVVSYVWGPSGVILQLNDSAHVIGSTPGLDTFYVIAADAIGCLDTVPFVVNVIEFGSFAMPTAFTPNGDQRNQYFFPVFNGPNSPAKTLALRIYNRWGQLVYDNPNPPGWDGTYGNKPQPIDVYTYFVTVEYPDPSDASKTVQKSVEGSFQLFR